MHKINIPEEALKQGSHLYNRLAGATTALVVIDLQNVFMLPGMPLEVSLARAIVPQVNRLAGAVRDAGGTVVWVQMTSDGNFDGWSRWYDRAPPEHRDEVHRLLQRGEHGHALHAELDVQRNDLKIEKTRYSAFIQGSSGLDRALRARGIDTVVVVGTLTNVCCESTARDAMMLNYKTIMVSDATATLSDEVHNATLANILGFFGDVRSTDELIAEFAASDRKAAAS
ncbi:MAG: cysteine hydrolase [Bradyrhizobiaceae bacterium]|nr:cysteine hydrolase [Bradyrhizobiaceae bacterium]